VRFKQQSHWVVVYAEERIELQLAVAHEMEKACLTSSVRVMWMQNVWVLLMEERILWQVLVLAKIIQSSPFLANATIGYLLKVGLNIRSFKVNSIKLKWSSWSRIFFVHACTTTLPLCDRWLQWRRLYRARGYVLPTFTNGWHGTNSKMGAPVRRKAPEISFLVVPIHFFGSKYN